MSYLSSVPSLMQTAQDSLRADFGELASERLMVAARCKLAIGPLVQKPTLAVSVTIFCCATNVLPCRRTHSAANAVLRASL